MEEKNKDVLIIKVSKSKIIIILCLILFVAGILVGSFVFFKKKPAIKGNENISNNTIDNNIDTINETEKDIKSLAYIYISELNPMENNCINKEISVNCLNNEEIIRIVLNKLSEDNKFEDKESMDTTSNDYLSFGVFKEYIKNMFGLDNYDIPNDYSMVNNSCHKYSNTGDKIKRYTDAIQCSFGSHGNITVDQWYYKYESMSIDGNNVTIFVVASYQYNDNIYEKKNDIYTDERKDVKVDDEFDSELKRLKYNFKYDNGFLTFISIESK